MVEAVWLELAAPHPVLSNRVSATRKTVEKANFDKDKTKNHRGEPQAPARSAQAIFSTGTLWVRENRSCALVTSYPKALYPASRLAAIFANRGSSLST
jgi:hypothetical protein